jgi:hypothetical protein
MPIAQVHALKPVFVALAAAYFLSACSSAPSSPEEAALRSACSGVGPTPLSYQSGGMFWRTTDGSAPIRLGSFNFFRTHEFGKFNFTMKIKGAYGESGYTAFQGVSPYNSFYIMYWTEGSKDFIEVYAPTLTCARLPRSKELDVVRSGGEVRYFTREGRALASKLGN